MNLLTSTLLTIFIPGFLMILATNPASADGPPPECFGCKVHFEKDKAISFPGFTLTFQGERKQPPPPSGGRFALGNCFDFQVKDGKNTSVICWSSGTGDIGPTMFLAGTSCYSLELKEADGIGKLAENELVVKLTKREYCTAAATP